MEPLEPLLAIAADLTSSLPAADRYDRLLRAVRRAIPCDAAALLRLDGEALVPLAGHGLVPEALGRRYAPAEHPRLAAILGASHPVVFPRDSPLPDPFDGLLEGDAHALEQVHACLGCPLVDSGEVVGALTADAFDPSAFDALDTRLLEALGALAGAALRTTALIEALERTAARHTEVSRDLLRDASRRSGGQLLGTSPAIEKVRREIGLVASSDLAVLVTGETGVGKELVARAVHAASRRHDEPLIYVNCAALPEHLAESELFGHVRGAFTGATADRTGKFEVADRGTLFLDEVGELPAAVQAKLLRALQQGEIQRVGSDRLHRVDVRIVAATNRDLAREVAAGRFRSDLFHRLAGYPIHVPPLRERRGDIPLLAGYFLDVLRRRLGLGPVRLAEAARRALTAAPWPGNVRELENLLNRAVLHAQAGGRAGAPVVVEERHLGLEAEELPAAPAGPAAAASATAPPAPSPAARPALPLRDALDVYQRSLIEQAVAANGGNWAAAARELGVHRSNLHHLARRLGLKA